MLPPFARLRAFEAAARLGGVSRAAAELGVTQPAVSQQLAALEALLEVRLMERRRGGGVRLTAEGAAYAQVLTRAFAEIDGATRRLTARAGDPVVTVSLLPTLAVRWLIPRLPSFQADNPDLEVRLSTTARLVDLDREDVDLAIRYGRGQWPRHEARFLMADDMFPVASPRLLARRPLGWAADLDGHTLLMVTADPRTGDWRRWLAAAGAAGVRGAHQLGFDSSAQAIGAALAGLGIAMAHRPFVADDLAAGRLVAPFDTGVPSSEAYFVVSAAGRTDRPAVARFRAWLAGEAGVSGSPTSPSSPAPS